MIWYSSRFLCYLSALAKVPQVFSFGSSDPFNIFLKYSTGSVHGDAYNNWKIRKQRPVQVGRARFTLLSWMVAMFPVNDNRLSFSFVNTTDYFLITNYSFFPVPKQFCPKFWILCKQRVVYDWDSNSNISIVIVAAFNFLGVNINKAVDSFP